MSVDLSAAEVSMTSGEARAGVIKTLLLSYNDTGNRETYRIVREGNFLHVVPVAIVGEDGTRRAFEPVLATGISFPEQHFETLYGLVGQVLGEVSQKRGISLVLGNVPANLFRRTAVVEAASDESAQEVLSRAFAETNGPRLAHGLERLAFLGLWYTIRQVTSTGSM